MTPEDAQQDSICSGCGALLQSEEPQKPGYIPREVLKERKTLICRRCFRIRNYNELTQTTPDENEFLKLLHQIGQTKALVVNIVDIFDFEGSFISGLQRFIGSNPVVLAVNKIDLLPEKTPHRKIEQWVRRQTKEMGLRAAEIVLCSAKKNIGFPEVIDAINRYRQGGDVYVVGATNVGKSTLINRLISDFSDLDRELTTSVYPGTTLGMVKIPLDDGRHIIDTPGIVYSHRLTEIMPSRYLPHILPQSPVKPRVYQLNDRQSLFFGAMARMDYVRGERQSFACFVANPVRVHRTKLERADELYREHRGGLLSPPEKEDLGALPPWVKVPIHLPKGRKTDILISGLGWIKAGKDGGDLEIYAPKGVKIAIRPSLI